MKRIKNTLIDIAGWFGIICIICFLVTGNLLLPVYGIISLAIGKAFYEETLTTKKN